MPEPPQKPMTIDAVMALAIECLKGGDLMNAGRVLRRVLDEVPEYPDALHYLGLLAHKEGRSGEAVSLMRRSLELVPDQADWHSNLGILLQARNDLEDAMPCFERAIALNPSHANAYNNLGVLLRLFRRPEEAEAAYRTAIELAPSAPDPHHNLAILLDATGRTPEAVIAYCRALTLKPEFPEIRRILALAYCTIGERDKAIALCETWIAEAPDDPAAAHTLAAVSGRNVPVRAGDAYVQQVFDNFSNTFEAKLARLDYRAPDLVIRSVAACVVSPGREFDVLDAGCGTGLCAPLLAPYARRLAGVDLSAGMLRLAADKQMYDELVQGELTAYLQARPSGFDLVVSADTLVYFGPLEEVAAAAAQALRPRGLLVFTVEEWQLDRAGDQEAGAADPGAGYCLRPHGRYNHRAWYVERVLRAVGLEVHLDRDTLRKEQGLPVPGLIVRAHRSPGPGDAIGAPAAGDPHV